MLSNDVHHFERKIKHANKVFAVEIIQKYDFYAQNTGALKRMRCFSCKIDALNWEIQKNLRFFPFTQIRRNFFRDDINGKLLNCPFEIVSLSVQWLNDPKTEQKRFHIYL